MNGQGLPRSDGGAGSSAPVAGQPSATPHAKSGLTNRPIVPDYDLLRRIGGGAYGDVWLARSQATGVLRAAKIVWRHTFEDDRPFQREFEGIQKFERISREHPSQLALFHIGRNDPEGYFYYVMELADDANVPDVAADVTSSSSNADHNQSLLPSAATYSPHTLRADLANGRLPAAQVLEIGLALTEALDHLHDHGLVHRDVKPSNVIFVNSRPKLADIGLVTDASDQCSIVGTEGYLPPEGPGTPQADIFALGKVLYEAATGTDRRQFPVLPADLREWPECGAVLELNPILLKACARNTRDRYGSAQQMQTDLALIQEGKSVRREFQRRKLLAIARRVGLAALTLGAAAVAFFTLWRELGRPYDISANHEVTNLIERGFACARSQTPDRLRQAEVDFQKATNLDRTFVPAHWGLFQVAVIRNEWTWDAPESAHQHIRSLAERLKKIAPNGAESHVAAAFIKWMDWKFAEAVAEDRIACRARAACREGRSAAHNVCGWHLLQRGHPEEALLEYREAERLYPSSPIAMHHLGHPYFVQRQFDQALKCYQASIEAETSNSLGHFWKGRVYEETGNFAGALEEFEESLRLSGQNPMSRKNREAVLEASVKDPDRGYWTKQLDLLPTNSPQNYYRIATLYAHLSDTTNAYSYLKKACEKQAFSQGPLFDPCWNKSDTNFQAIVRSIGLLQ